MLSIDGFGERTSTAFGVANKKDIKILETIDFPHSLGSFYETVTEFLGYKADADEWKDKEDKLQYLEKEWPK